MSKTLEDYEKEYREIRKEYKKLGKQLSRITKKINEINHKKVLGEDKEITAQGIMALEWNTVGKKLYNEIKKYLWNREYPCVQTCGFYPKNGNQVALQIALWKNKDLEQQAAWIKHFIPYMNYHEEDGELFKPLPILSFDEKYMVLYIYENGKAELMENPYYGKSFRGTIEKFDNVDKAIAYIHKNYGINK